MNKKNINLKTAMWMGLFVFLTIIPSIIFSNQAYDLDEFDDLEKKKKNLDNCNGKKLLNQLSRELELELL